MCIRDRFLSELRQMSTKFDNFWNTDSTKDRFIWDALIFYAVHLLTPLNTVALTRIRCMGRLKTREWKTRDHLIGVENARPVAMERQSYKESKTEIVVIVHYWKHTSTIAQAVKNHCRKKYILMLNNDLNTQRHKTARLVERAEIARF